MALHQVLDGSIGQHDAACFAGSPRLRISCRMLQQQARRFMSGFPGHTSYAVKANDHPGIIRLLGQSGLTTFDVASLGEMASVKNQQPSARLHYHNPARSKEETRIAIERFGCRRFAVDHPNELQHITQLVPNRQDTEIAIRFRDNVPTGAVQAFQSKFGVGRNEAGTMLKTAAQAGFRVGLTFHPGSQTLGPEPYERHIAIAANISRQCQVELDFLNVGGGFPAEYLGLTSSTLETFFDRIAAAHSSCFAGTAPTLECEPGRAMVAKSGTLQVAIKAVRTDRRELFLNDGIYGGLMEPYLFSELRPQYIHFPRQDAALQQRDWKVYGPTCDPADVLPFTLHLDHEPSEGDRIDFLNMGAYSTATATRFNGFGGLETVFV